MTRALLGALPLGLGILGGPAASAADPVTGPVITALSAGTYADPRLGNPAAISYSFNSTEWTTVTVTVTDSRGNTLRTLDTEQAPSGTFATSWDGRDSQGNPVPDGAYNIVATPAGYDYAYTIGSAGSGDGHLQHPQGVAVAPDGTVWVGDTGNNRYEQFSAAGDYLSQIPFPGAWTVHAEADGTLDLATDNNSVTRMSPSGSVVASFSDPSGGGGLIDLQREDNGNWLMGADDCCPQNRAMELTGLWDSVTQPTELRSYSWYRTTSVTTLSSGFIGVASNPDSIYGFFDASPRNFWNEYAFCFPNYFGCLGLGSVGQITADGTNVLLALPARDQIAEMPFESTVPVWTIGSPGGAHGQLDSPMSAVISNGRLLLADANNNRVEVYTAARPVSVPVIVDTRGPAITSASVTDDIGVGNLLNSTVDDSATGASPILGAEYFVDTTGPDGTGIAMAAQDGSFDTDVENAFAYLNIPAGSLPVSEHHLFIHGRDAAGNWGGFAVLNVLLTPAGIQQLPL